MALKKKSSTTSSPRCDRGIEITLRIKDLENQQRAIKEEIKQLQKEKLEIEIAPFKVGDCCMAKVPSGRTPKMCKCLIECEGGILYLRPFTKEGNLSNRHFSLIPRIGNPYSDYLKPVEE